MIKPLASFVLVLFMAAIQPSAPPSSLSDLLWSRVQTCYAHAEDLDDEGLLAFDKVDDAQNGYLKVSGSWPTCGCSCSSTVAAFKDLRGEYTLLQREEFLCAWKKVITSNRDLSTILPENLGEQFLPKDILYAEQRARFFYDVDIPRHGTDTKLTVRVIPLGLIISDSSAIGFAYSEAAGYEQSKSLYNIRDIARQAEDKNCLDHIINGTFQKLSPHDRSIINDAIGDDDSQFASEAVLQSHVKELEKTYDLYLSLKAESVLLGWDKEKARFYVKHLGEKPEVMTFWEFLTTSEYWSVMC